MTVRRLVLLLLLVLAAPIGARTAAAEKERHAVLVLKDGRQLRVQKWVQKGPVTEVTSLEGAVTVVRTDLIDFEKTRLATEAAMRPPTPTPAPTRKKSLVEVAREATEERRRRAAAAEGTPEVVPGKLPPLAAVTVPPRPVATTPPGGMAVITTPTPAPVATVAAGAETPTPAPEETPTPAAAATPPPPEGLSPFVLYGGVAGLLGVVAIGGLLALKRRARPAAPPALARGKAQPAAAAKPAAGEDLLVPAFADEAPAEDLPMPVPVAEESLSAPAELKGGASELRAISDGRATPPSVLEPGREIQVRIQADVYTCPDAETLRRWVEEGRVIENSEVLAPDGSWLLAGSIPDLEQAFERRRDTLGY